MPLGATDRIPEELEDCRHHCGRKNAGRAATVLDKLAARKFSDAASLIRFHESLLFLRAFPHSPGVQRKTEKLLDAFFVRVQQLRDSGADMSAFSPLEVSGIAGTEMQDSLSFDVARWLVRHMPGRVRIDWDNYDEERAMAATWPRWIPLLEEDGYVEASIPWRDWVHTAQGNKSGSPAWLISRFEDLQLPDAAKAELYDSLRLPLIWELDNLRLSRTRNWLPVRKAFHHHEPLIARNEVSLASELAKRPPALKHLSSAQGRRVMDTIREVMLVRYRELYGTTLGDPKSVVCAELERGVTIYMWNLLPAPPPPLPPYAAGFPLNNALPFNSL